VPTPYIHSPFTQLQQRLFQPNQTAAAVGSTLADISDKTNPLMLAKRQSLDRGVSRSLYGYTSGQGAAAAAMRAAPVAQRFQDAAANAEWDLSRDRANEGYSNAMLGRLFDTWNDQYSPAAIGRRIIPGMNLIVGLGQPDGLLGNLFPS
jgi:uncharacterized protein YfaS (alpha-2-macroglobulin family)